MSDKLEIMTVRVPTGSLALIDTLLKGGELRAGFIRAALSREIVARLSEKEQAA